MPYSGLPLDVYLIFDNSTIVGLCEYFCDTNGGAAFPETIETICQCVSTTFNKLRKYALAGKLFTTQLVQNEFLPENSDLAARQDFDRRICQSLKSHIKGEIEVCEINVESIEILRSMTQTPFRFGQHLCRLSDPDLSLVILALGIINQTGSRTYILTDDEDLRSFISWMKSRPEVRRICPNSNLLDGLHSMVFMDNAHRECLFSTVEIYDMFTFYQAQQLKRMFLAGTEKGSMIESTFRVIQQAIRESGEIKKRKMAGLA